MDKPFSDQYNRNCIAICLITGGPTAWRSVAASALLRLLSKKARSRARSGQLQRLVRRCFGSYVQASYSGSGPNMRRRNADSNNNRLNSSTSPFDASAAFPTSFGIYGMTAGFSKKNSVASRIGEVEWPNIV